MFGDNLKKYRTEKGLSQNDIAEKLFVTRQCVSKWEKGITQPDLQSLSDLSDLLGVTVDELVKDCGERKKRSNGNYGLFVATMLAAAFCVIAFLIVWRFAPQTIPAHWTHGKIDRYGSRNEILLNLISVALFAALDIILFFVLRRTKDRREVRIAHGTVIFFLAAYFVFIAVLYAGYLTGGLSWIVCLSADLLLCFSVAMHPRFNKPNALLGVRIAETLSSTEIWNKTNALASYLFSVCSAAIIIFTAVFPSVFSLLWFAAYIILTVITIVYAKRLAKTQSMA